MPAPPIELDSGISSLRGRTVAVLGHPVLDRYLFGVTHRISREAPVLIVREEREELSLGGAGNTAANIAGLGGRAQLVGPVGDDPEADKLVQRCGEDEVDASGLVRGASPVTITKTRVLAGGVHTTRQQMLRIDRESDAAPTPEEADRMRQAGLQALTGLDALIVSDYGNGGWVEVWRSVAQAARAQGLPVVVDSRHASLAYEGVTAITPNEPEAEEALGRRIRTPAEAERAALELRDRLGLEAVLLTRGKEGMVVAEAEARLHHVPAVGGEAVDVTGAGDTVAATFALGLAAQTSILAAARLANLAASVVVQRTGTVPITAEALLRAARFGESSS